ncbi:hypothetical protein B296_00048492 [Ensete ventricosum]|uniref:Aspartic peptidase DDI1-type domain-containing protein n=1 Tax=Ensete ventricosum TaxID=4639 RepID=A0A426YUI1_ENSVE|nr:hypothetical protein B296_00048492 [Ensete ventricosum]
MKIRGFLKQQPITILVNTGSTNNFMDIKVDARMTLQIEDCIKFDVKVADGRFLKCDKKCQQVRLVLQGEEIVVGFFLLPLDDYEVVPGIERLSTLSPACKGGAYEHYAHRCYYLRATLFVVGATARGQDDHQPCVAPPLRRGDDSGQLEGGKRG